VVLALVGAACSSSSKSSASSSASATSTSSSAAAAAPAEHVTLHLGFFPNLTHATALVGVEQGIFAKDLGPNVKLVTATFNAGPAEVQALFSDALDAAYLGPNSAINDFTQSSGSNIVVISGATSGGAALVVKPDITGAAQLKGAKLATPQLGNTQDVALRYWLQKQGLTSTTQGGGVVDIEPQSNSTAVQAFQAGLIQGGWEPEPYASEMVADGGHVLVDERTQWPNGKFATTVLAVRKAFLRDHPDVVKALLQGQIDANTFVNANPTLAQTDANTEIAAITGKALSASLVSSAWSDMTFTDDPVATSFQADADHAEAVGLGKSVTLTGLVDVTLLNQLLTAAGQSAVPTS
jgi:NitT/TauT family transport system substrate-binding protein